jgi:hypothetical protein
MERLRAPIPGALDFLMMLEGSPIGERGAPLSSGTRDADRNL